MKCILLLALAASATSIPVPLRDDPTTQRYATEAGVLLEKPVPPGLCDTVRQHAGYFNVTTSTKRYFYWFFESRSAPTVDPLVLWMTGGPGCSSGIALFNENGPCSVEASGMSTRKNPFSWNSNASLLFIDQPAGTGFSYGNEDTDYDHNERQVSEDMYNFLQAFYQAHPEYKPNPFFVFGESYGGHFVPATAGAILAGNGKADKFEIPLTGVGVGNGLTAPEIQYGYYGVYAGESPVGPLVPTAVSLAMRASSEICVREIAACQKTPDYVQSAALLDAIAQYNVSGANAYAAVSALLGDQGLSPTGDGACDAAFIFCALSQVTPVQSTGLNLYDVRQQCKHPPLCYDFGLTTEFLNLAHTQAQLGVHREWSSCNMQVNAKFRADWMHSFKAAIPDLLDADIRVLVYAGEMDYICNYMGNKAWTLALDWTGKAKFNEAGDHKWLVKGKEAGLARSAQGFTFLQVHDAGHMVPLDQPANSLAMVRAFLDNKPFY